MLPQEGGGRRPCTHPGRQTPRELLWSRWAPGLESLPHPPRRRCSAPGMGTFPSHSPGLAPRTAVFRGTVFPGMARMGTLRL